MALHDAAPLPDAPYSLDLLADLHAGVLDDAVSNRLWPLVREDPDAMFVITALDRVSARLGEVGRESASGLPIPPHVAERIDRSLDAATHVDELSRRRKRMLVTVSAAASVLLLGAVLTAITIGSVGSDTSGSDTSNTVADGPAAPTLIVDSGSVDDSIAYSVMGESVDVPLVRSGALASCLAANGFDADSPVLGNAPIEVDGREGVVLVLPQTGPGGGLTLLAVQPDCAEGNPATLLQRDLG